MKRISAEKEIIYISNVIEKNIEAYGVLKDKGLMSQNILSQLRNIVEATAILISNKYNGTDYDSHYNNIGPSFDFVAARGEFKFVNEFHDYLQGTASHYTPNDDGAEKLVSYYYRYMCMLKNMLKDEFNLEIIRNIDDFPIYDDITMKENYVKICEQIEDVPLKETKNFKDGRFYVQNTRTIYSKGKMYYEYTLTKATDYINKFERITMYSKIFIPDYYSIKIFYEERDVELFFSKVKVKIITNYSTSIRVCELRNISKILNNYYEFSDNLKEYRNLMDYLTESKETLLEIISKKKVEYDTVIDIIHTGAENAKLSDMLTVLRTIILRNRKGSNVLRYLLTKLDNIVVRDQIFHEYTSVFRTLRLDYRCGPFETMPYAMSLHGHNTSWFHLTKAIDMFGREHELLSRIVRNNSESKNILYTPASELEFLGDIDALINKYNYILINYKVDKNGINVLVHEHNDVFIKSYEEKTLDIIDKIGNYYNSSIGDMQQKIDLWLTSRNNMNISEEKIDILKSVFNNSSVAIIHGSAGTGKTKMLEAFADIFKDYNKVFLANTNTAVGNLVNRIFADNSSFMTVASITSKKIKAVDLAKITKCDILFIDECSTVSNDDMINILKRNNYKMIILSGDTFQIESIKYGNWFSICNYYFKNYFVYELGETFRTNNEGLLNLWTMVRNDDKHAVGLLSNQEYSQDLNEDLFNRVSDDEIILCLNYDGIYGINNINKIMQYANPNKEFNIGVDTFKVEDRILFNDCPRFKDFFYTNLKGIIKKIVDDGESGCTYFTIQVDEADIDLDKAPGDVSVLRPNEEGKLNVVFKVGHFKDRDDDENIYDHVIPFNLSYAISIHKAQGLEYDSVKIVITPNVEDNITKNIFYTAITRTKKHLKIYWNSDSHTKIFQSFEKKSSSRDAAILRQKIISQSPNKTDS